MENTLYKINENYLSLLNDIENLQGEITPEIENALIINEKELKVKSTSYLAVITDKKTNIDLLEAEIKRLQAIKKTQQRIKDNLETRLLDAVKLYGNFEVGFTKFGTRKSTIVTVEDVNTLPKDYKTIKVTETANKTKIKASLNAGESIKGCELVNKLNLKIN